MKKFVLLMIAALLVSCGDSPKSILDECSASKARVAESLGSKDSRAEKEDVIKEEIERMRELTSAARAVKATPEEYFSDEYDHRHSEDAIYAERLYLYYTVVSEKQDFSSLLAKYNKQIAEVESELKRSCEVKK